MTKAELEAKRIALVAEAEVIIEAHERLRFIPANSPEHAAHRIQVQLHQDHLRTTCTSDKRPVRTTNC